MASARLRHEVDGYPCRPPREPVDDGRGYCRWWHDYVENKAEIHFQKGRIRFLLNGIEPRYCVLCKIRWIKEISHCENCYNKIGKSSPTYDNVWIIFRKKKTKIMGCKGVCEEYKTGRTKNGTRYGDDKKRCTKCDIFIEYKGGRCNQGRRGSR